MNVKSASTSHLIHELLAARWSPYCFDNEPIAKHDLQALFEAARWAPSSYNEQPWSYIVATQDNPKEFNRLLSCLVEPNQVWAREAPVLALCMVSHRFKRNGKENRAAVHDLGLASGNLSVEATARGLYVHQMIGILPEKARELYHIPEEAEAWTALAIGYKTNTSTLPDELKERDQTPRQRKPLDQFVFGPAWGQPSSIAANSDD